MGSHIALLAFQEQQLLPLNMCVDPHSQCGEVGMVLVPYYYCYHLHHGPHLSGAFQIPGTVLSPSYLLSYWQPSWAGIIPGITSQMRVLYTAEQGMESICPAKATLGLKRSTHASLQLPLERQSYSQEIMQKCIYAYVRRIPLTAVSAPAVLAGIVDGALPLCQLLG